MKQFIACLLLAGLTLNCKNNSIDSNQLLIPGCQVSAINKGPTDKHAYTYDGQGRITGMTRTTDGGSGTIQQYIYTFTYDNAGKLANSSWTVNDKADGTAQYAYDNGRIARSSTTYADGKTSTSTIKYYVNSRISEFTVTSDRPNGNGRRYFEYDANGIITKTGFSDLKGVKYFEVITKPVGQVKLPDQLLAKNGLPFDVLTGFPWQETIGGIGTTADTYFVSSNTGQLVFAYTGTTTAIQTNAQGFLTDFSLTDQDKKVYTQKYTITNCAQ